MLWAAAGTVQTLLRADLALDHSFFALVRRTAGNTELHLTALWSLLTQHLSLFPTNPLKTSLWLAASCGQQTCSGLGTNYVCFFSFRSIRDKHNNFKEAIASRWRSQQGPAAKSWYGVSLTLIQSDTWVSPKPSHCVLQMYINISMHWHNMDPLFQMLMRARCCIGAAAAF